MRPKLLLHVCCATCAAYVLEELRRGYEVTAYYYNPNIYPKEEYQKRIAEARNYCQHNSIPFIEEPPDQGRWFLLTKGHEADPERGERCTICYEMRLEKTAQYAQQNGYDMFGADLSISPHKDAERLNRLGEELGKVYGGEVFSSGF